MVSLSLDRYHGCSDRPRPGRPAHTWLLGAICCLAAVWATGCEGAFESDDGTVHFHPLQPSESLVRSIPDPGSRVPPEEYPDQFKQMLERIRRHPVRMFDEEVRRKSGQQLGENEFNAVLDELERIFLGTGRYLELVAIYQKAYDAHGLDSVAAPRFAWILVRIGQFKQARDLIDELDAARPDDPIVAFLEGMYWLNRSDESRVDAARAALAWERALELDPDFQGYDKLGADKMRRQISAIESALPADPEKLVEAADSERADAPGDARADASSADSADRPQTHGDDGSTPGPVADGSGRRARRSDEADDAREAETDDDETDGSQDAEKAPDETDDSAEKDAKTGKTEDSKPVNARLVEADMAASSGDLDEAESIYSSILAEAPDHLEAQLGRLKVRWRKDDADPNAVGKLQKWLDHDDLEASLAYDVGLFARSKLNNPSLADKYFERVRVLDPEFADRVGVGD